MIRYINYNFNNDIDWVLDTRATHHICHNKHLFYSMNETTNYIVVYLPNGEEIEVHGSIKISNQIEF